MTGKFPMPFVYAVAALAVALLLNACAYPTAHRRTGLNAQGAHAVLTPPPHAPIYASPAGAGDYRVDAGDRLRVTVFGEDTLTGEYMVDGGGAISMPLISRVPIAGMTTDQVATEIERRLRAGYLRKPSVSVQILAYRPFYILGEVRRAGQYPYVDGMTVQHAVATAGGYTPRARESRFKVTRPTPTGSVVLRLRSNAKVLPGDTIYVEERLF